MENSTWFAVVASRPELVIYKQYDRRPSLSPSRGQCWGGARCRHRRIAPCSVLGASLLNAAISLLWLMRIAYSPNTSYEGAFKSEKRSCLLQTRAGHWRSKIAIAIGHATQRECEFRECEFLPHAHPLQLQAYVFTIGGGASQARLRVSCSEGNNLNYVRSI